MAESSFKLGLSTKVGAPSGPYGPFAFRPASSAWHAASQTRRHQTLWDAACDLAAEIDPAFHFTTVAFNKNFAGSRHRDEKDAGPQLAAAFGDYSGGELRVHGEAGAMDIDTRHRSVRPYLCPHHRRRYEHEP